MITEELFKKYDIRGEGITPEFALQLGKAYASNYGDVIISRDNKSSSEVLGNNFIKGVLSQGFNVYDIGVMPTDASSFASASLKMNSCMITASHLSDSCDGFKFNYSNGASFMLNDLNALKNAYRLDYKNKSKGRYFKIDLMNDYLKSLTKSYYRLFNSDLSGLKIILDLKGGVSQAPALLKALNAEVIVINSKGAYPNKSNLSLLSREVITNKASLGASFDYDADRVVFVDEGGIVIEGNHISCLLSRLYGSPVIASIDSSSIVESYSSIKYSPVGDPNVTHSLMKHQGVLSVEPSGHYTDPLHAYCSSGTLFCAVIGGLCRSLPVSSLINELPQVNVYRIDLRVSDSSNIMKRALELSKAYELISLIDGYKFRYKDGVALIRASGTEDLVRFQFESKNNLINELIGEFN